MVYFLTQFDVAHQYSYGFIKSRLPQHGRVLEVGCGRGDLAADLTNEGYELVAIDNDEEAIKETARKGVQARHCDFLSFPVTELFDTVLFTRSLHHIYPIAQALRRTLELLRPGGTAVIEDFDWKAMDQKTARWLYRLSGLLVLSGSMEASELSELRDEDPLSYWNQDHQHEPPLNSGAEMKEAATNTFRNVELQSCPYLFRYFRRDLKNTEANEEIAKTILKWERELIAAREIVPIGLRIVAVKGV